MDPLIEDPVDVMELNGSPRGPYIPPAPIPALLTASVWATHADGSIGRIGSWGGGARK